MKGLFIKDLLLMKNQKRSALIMLVLCIFYAFMGMSEFASVFFGLLLMMQAIGTIAYDEADNGNAFLFTMPFSEKEYVAEKYILSIGASLVGCILGIIITQVYAIATHKTAEDPLSILDIAAPLLVYILMAAIMLPLRFRFGSERSRTAVYLVFAGMILLFTALSGLFKGDAIKQAMNKLDTLPAGLVAGVGCGAAVVFLAVSIVISLGILRKKEY